MIKLKNLLLENMRRFKTKNLNEDEALDNSTPPVDAATETAFINTLVNNRNLYLNDNDPNMSVTEFKEMDSSYSKLDYQFFAWGQKIEYMGVFNYDKYDTSKSNELYAKFKYIDHPGVRIKLFAKGKCVMPGKPRAKFWRFIPQVGIEYNESKHWPATGKDSVITHKSKHDIRYAGQPGFDPKKDK
jgi:hypothetical protein